VEEGGKQEGKGLQEHEVKSFMLSFPFFLSFSLLLMSFVEKKNCLA
jgi:hypothetical protein